MGRKSFRLDSTAWKLQILAIGVMLVMIALLLAPIAWMAGLFVSEYKDEPLTKINQVLAQAWGWQDKVTPENATEGFVFSGSAAHWYRFTIKPSEMNRFRNQIVDRWQTKSHHSIEMNRDPGSERGPSWWSPPSSKEDIDRLDLLSNNGYSTSTAWKFWLSHADGKVHMKYVGH